jgi:hypothetical protein
MIAKRFSTSVAQSGDLLLRDYKLSSKSGVDPGVHLDHAGRLRMLQAHPKQSAAEAIHGPGHLD